MDQLLKVGLTIGQYVAGIAKNKAGNKLREVAEDKGIEELRMIGSQMQEDAEKILDHLQNLAETPLHAAKMNIKQGMIILSKATSESSATMLSGQVGLLSLSPPPTEDVQHEVLSPEVIPKEERPSPGAFNWLAQLPIPESGISKAMDLFKDADRSAKSAYNNKSNNIIVRIEAFKIILFCHLTIRHEYWMDLWKSDFEEFLNKKEIKAAMKNKALLIGKKEIDMNKQAINELFFTVGSTIQQAGLSVRNLLPSKEEQGDTKDLSNLIKKNDEWAVMYYLLQHSKFTDYYNYRIGLIIPTIQQDSLMAKILLIFGCDNVLPEVLCYACESGDTETTRLLLTKSNVDINGWNWYGLTPLHYASRWGHRDIIQLLIDNNADINAENIDGSTPLHAACYRGHKEVVKLLIDSNPDVTVKEMYGKSALGYAIEEGHREIAELFTK